MGDMGDMGDMGQLRLRGPGATWYDLVDVASRNSRMASSLILLCNVV